MPFLQGAGSKGGATGPVEMCIWSPNHELSGGMILGEDKCQSSSGMEVQTEITTGPVAPLFKPAFFFGTGSSLSGCQFVESPVYYKFYDKGVNHQAIQEEAMSAKRVLTGIQPSGILHIGNYFGTMRQSLAMQQEHDCFYFIANYHAMTSMPEPKHLKERTFQVALDFLACGLDPVKTIFFRQSDVSEVQVLSWILSCLCPLGLLERCHSYKDKLAHGLEANHGLLAYPVLMAADILLYDSNLVPVGKDQKQHLEVTRDLAIRFNNRYGENLLVVPEPLIQEEVAVVPGLDGQKMSKSYDNTIEIFGEGKAVRGKFMRIVTDSTPLEDPKDADHCNVFALYKLMATPEEQQELRERYKAGGMGYGHAKQALFEKYSEYFKEMRERRKKLLEKPGEVEDILQDGAARARKIARVTMERVLAAVGL